MNTVYITKEARDYMRACVMAVKGEIGGFGFVTTDAAGRYVWHKTFLVPQIVSSSEVDYDTTGGLAYAVEKALAEGFFEDPNALWGKWHSHGGLASYWSSTDDKMNEALRLTGVKSLIDHVTNRKGESKTRLEMYEVDHHGLYIPQLTLDDLTLAEYVDDTLTRQALADIAELVVEKKYTAPPKGGSSNQGSKSHTVPRSDLPGEKVEKALDQRDAMSSQAWRDSLDESPSADAAYDAAGDDDDPWLPTLWSAESLPNDAVPISDEMDLDDPTLDGFEAAGYTIVRCEGERFLVESDALDNAIWQEVQNLPDAEDYEEVNAEAMV